jgi:peptide/nickel transport system permease protein
MSLRRYLARRLGFAVVTLVGAITAVFILTNILPGSPAEVKLGGFATPESIAALERQMGLDKPLWQQYGRYFWNLLHGDMGTSWISGHPVTDDLLRRLPASAELALCAVFLAMLVGLPLGIMAALKKDSMVDQAARFIAIFGASVPLFWLGLMMILIFYSILDLAPPPMGRVGSGVITPERITGFLLIDALVQGNFDAFMSAVGQLALPSISLAVIVVSSIIKISRSATLEVLRMDYVQTARSIGLSMREIVTQDVLKNAFIPILTMLGIVLGYLLAGNVIVERIFAWPGIGSYAWNAILSKDLYAVQGFVLLIAFIYVGINLVIDILYILVDPRIRLG